MRALGADAYWGLGDFAAIGPEPVAVLERLAALENATVIRGNTDRYVVTGEGPPPSSEEARANPDLIHLFARVAASFAWTRGYVTAAGWLDWLEKLRSRRGRPCQTALVSSQFTRRRARTTAKAFIRAGVPRRWLS
jgi:hypothetical protein